MGDIAAALEMLGALRDDIAEMQSRKGAVRFPSVEQLGGWRRMADSIGPILQSEKARADAAEARIAALEAGMRAIREGSRYQSSDGAWTYIVPQAVIDALLNRPADGGESP